MTEHYLSRLFRPKSVAVFGASEREGAVGTLVFANMLSAKFKGDVFPINVKRKTVQGVTAFPSLSVIKQSIDLAVITTPADTVLSIINQCGEAGIKNAVVISAGFREIGPIGKQLEDKVCQRARDYGIRFIGPNCLGIMHPSIGLNATFNHGQAKPGKLALVSQSGAICTAILDWASANNVGFSHVISTGISADLGFGEILDYLLADSETKGILLYIEGITNSRSFMSALRAAARVKPVIVLKVGRHESGSQAAMSHTGAMAGSDTVFDAALRRAGAVRCHRINELFAAATTLTSNLSIKGNRLVIITNGGGPGAIASDAVADMQLQMAKLSPETVKQLGEVLPSTWSHGNPVDVIGDATADRYEKALRICMADHGVDGALVMLTPQAMTKPTEVAQSLINASKELEKPLLTCWMGETQVKEGREAFSRNGIPHFPTPEAAIQAFFYLYSHYQNQQLLLQTPCPRPEQKKADLVGASMIIEAAMGEGRSVLSEAESKAVLAAFHIPSTHSIIVRSAQEALVQAQEIGYPVAMKVNSPNITHKSDAGGIRLGLNSAVAVRTAFNEIIESVKENRPEAIIDGVTIQPMINRTNARELLIGISTDPIFGPVVTVGSGGTAVEVINDSALMLPPLNGMLIEDMLKRTRVIKMLGAFRHMPAVKMDALFDVLWRISELACEINTIQELDINPLFVDEQGVIAADARIKVGYGKHGERDYDHMAIHPYPAALESHIQLADGTDILIRPIRPEDAEIEQTFVRGLSPESKYFRFMQQISELTPLLLSRFTQIDYYSEMALIAVVKNKHEEKQIAVGRYNTNPDNISCEFAIVVSDEWHGRGIAHQVMQKLIESARYHGFEKMQGDVLASNYGMISLVKNLGFKLEVDPEDSTVLQVTKWL